MLVEESASLGPPARVVVVDNDAGASARAVVSEWSSAGVEYLVEPRPGIAAARNRILDASRSADAVVFIDDDQVPLPGWLASITTSWETWGCAAVAGPVVWSFDAAADEWVRASRRFVRRAFPPGSERSGAGTGNLLLDLEFARRNALRFDDRFGLTGGEDTLFTRMLRDRGGTIRWCDEAEVIETVPRERLTRAWILNRDVRSGNAWARVHLQLERSRTARLRRRADLLLRATWRCLSGARRVAIGRASGRIELVAAGERDVASAVGMVKGVLGIVIEEYGRP
jgi:succinoglycan biosynthesis protein ExoM